MKASELVQALNALIEEHGDLVVQSEDRIANKNDTKYIYHQTDTERFVIY